MAKNYHVVSRSDGGWIVRKEGESRASGVFRSRSDAVSYATNQAKNACSEIVIHGRDGRIRSRDSYGKDPCPPRDRR